MAEPEVQRSGNSEMQLKSKAVKKSCKYLLKQSSDGRGFEEKEKRKEKLK